MLKILKYVNEYDSRNISGYNGNNSDDNDIDGDGDDNTNFDNVIIKTIIITTVDNENNKKCDGTDNEAEKKE